MSAQTIADVFIPVDARYRAQVQYETWGHLAPRKNKKYKGYIIFAVGCFGTGHLNPTALECELELDSSPWFFNVMMDFLRSMDGETGCVYRWDGYFRNYEFVGSVRRMALA
jgi:hypothetical protein